MGYLWMRAWDRDQEARSPNLPCNSYSGTEKFGLHQEKGYLSHTSEHRLEMHVQLVYCDLLKLIGKFCWKDQGYQIEKYTHTVASTFVDHISDYCTKIR